MKKPQLLVREVDPKLVKALKERAAANNRSAEAEHREILERALRGGTERVPLAEALMKIPAGGNESDFQRVDDDGSRDVFN